MSRRAVITGVGVVAPGGIGTKAYWKLLSEGRTATRNITHFDASPYRSRMAGEADFDPVREGLTPQEIRRLDRAAQFAVVAGREAMSDSGIEFDQLDPGRIGVSLGTAVGCTTSLEREFIVGSDRGKYWEVDQSYAVPHLYDYFTPSSMATELAWTVGAEGPVSVVSTGCTSGLDSVGYAAELIMEGSADVVVTGGTEAPLSPITVVCFDVIRASSTRNDDPTTACRPFDKTRDGLVLGEGCAIIVLEELEHARARGAHIYGEVAGFASRCNAYHMTGLHPEGIEMSDAINIALKQARADATDVGYINAHGSGTKQNDLHETAAFKRSLGAHAYKTPVSGFKSMIGHSLGAIGSLEIVGSLLAFEQDLIPPTANLHEQDPECDLDYTPLVAREKKVDTLLTVGSGFGGFQSAMVLKKVEGAGR
ncbi:MULTISPECIES: beta-ketoacyl-[acyl-carrier-protein] synthase family protein [Lentzea]|jgi:act minimal PKS ketosynthase (KS/KS alpha)|uniref:Act minimal PKS ketosynthase (KS/KS alpha) n=5 Tax=Lentzea TaxID=165301 RepID=A0A1W2F0H4_9PSEU|nr:MULTISPECIES: beta-ketoacyl-[acyl-carrier-protein] synthase family protein [Lentzea]MCR3751558.1 act minimal PKS ketosynthase (KS/KS alpha) [Lentzea californiensis]MCX2954807.1 beta-ketoacyl-[acyl-carrier-protein] synthase family protein [Lentzea sp. NEAU-D7]MDX8050215.1 beta-ketoacyl-[acyl-carrier-protein] synthase family protein [Lentzea sp. BCCO 10_0798]RDI20409.1 act minimal PKS ketosynthase (KS/KS alpha) [Lentzea flaviverrucosa]SDK36476.1 act minimal PKS ketosynthase (KS/KS alpha) [Len